MTSYSRGDRSPAVRQVRRAVAALSAPTPAPPSGDADDVFDAALDSAVRAFQQRRGLVVDGVVGAETWAALQAAGRRLGDRLLAYSVSRRHAGDDVAELQQRLLDMGFDTGRTDGVFGSRTEAALRAFQRERQLRVDGVCGPATLRELDLLRRTVRGGNAHELREAEKLRRLGPSLAGRTVVVDAGHGGSDDGAVAHGVCEREVVGDIAARLEGRLLASGVSAVLTHPPTESPTELDRARVANETGADLVVSLHADGASSPRVQGVATYYYGAGLDSPSVVGARLADLVQKEVVARTDLLDCRTHPKTWELLRLTAMPAVRLDVGCLTSPSDARRLHSQAFRDTVAEAVLVAIQRLILPAELDPPTGQLRLPAGFGRAPVTVG